MLGMKQSCTGCHFFVKEARSLPSPNPITVDVTNEERSLAAKGDFSWAKEPWTLACHFGVWDEGYNFDKSKRQTLIAETDRRDYCFFWPYRQGMLIPPGKVLEQREAEAREASRDRRLTIWGLWIAAIALVIDIGLRIAERLDWWPFLAK